MAELARFHQQELRVFLDLIGWQYAADLATDYHRSMVAARWGDESTEWRQLLILWRCAKMRLLV